MTTSEVPRAVPGKTIPRLEARVWLRLTGLFVMSRLLILTIAALSHTAITQGYFAVRAKTWVERLGNWDSVWYLQIVEHGYHYNPTGQSSAAFYPLYPLLIKAAMLLGLDDRLAGYLISNLALYLACLLIWRLAARETRSPTIAERTVLFVLLCPGAIWFSLIYTESLFLVTVAGCLLCARRGRWLAAGLWGMASALTRTPGLFLSGFLFLEALQQWWERRSLRAVPVDPATPRRWRLAWWQRAGLAVLGPVAGQVTYLIFLQVRFGDWRAQQKTVAAGWNGAPHWPWDAVVLQWQTLDRIFVDVSMPLLGLVLVLAIIGLVTLKRVGYATLTIALAILYLSATPGDSVTRYLCTTVPVFIVLAQLSERSKLLETTTLVFSVATMTVLTALRANGYRII